MPARRILCWTRSLSNTVMVSPSATPTTLPAMFCAQDAAGTDMVAKSARTRMRRALQTVTDDLSRKRKPGTRAGQMRSRYRDFQGGGSTKCRPPVILSHHRHKIQEGVCKADLRLSNRPTQPVCRCALANPGGTMITKTLESLRKLSKQCAKRLIGDPLP